jgi:[ribosomal protein S5]-alanine N-acetyltransferase
MIETQRLLIRKFTPADADDLFAYLSLPETYIYEPGEPVTLEQARELAAVRAQGDHFFAVVLKAENKLIGHLYFEKTDPPEFMTWELGYIFNPIYQHRGYASEASSAFVDYAFSHYHAHRIMARCDPRNTASWKLLEKVGFVREGHFIKCASFRVDADGQPNWHDAFEYSLLEKGV